MEKKKLFFQISSNGRAGSGGWLDRDGAWIGFSPSGERTPFLFPTSSVLTCRMLRIWSIRRHCVREVINRIIIIIRANLDALMEAYDSRGWRN